MRQKQQELEHAIRSGHSPHQLAKAAEQVRAAQLSLLKARLHWLSEAQIQRSGTFHPATRDYGQIDAMEKTTHLWKEKSVEEILCEHRKT